MATLASQVLTPFLREINKLGPEMEAEARREVSAQLGEMGIAIEAVESFQLRIPHDVAITLLSVTAELTRDRGVAQRAAANFELGDFEPYDYVCRHCATLGESVVASRDYLPLMHDGIEAELLTQGDQTLWRNRLRHGLQPSPEINEFLMSSLLTSARRNTGLPLGANVTFMHAAPSHARELEEFFAGSVTFDAPYNSFLMPTAALAIPLLEPDLVLGRVLRRHADDCMRLLPARRPITHAVTELVVADLDGAGAVLKTIAKRMHMSESTLRRRLSEEGRTFSDVAEEARLQSARQLLIDPQVPLAEVGQRLGFAHAPAFHRAFKRWTGMTPAQYRSHASDNLVTRFLSPL